jgi:putative phosphoribosyl transferase
MIFQNRTQAGEKLAQELAKQALTRPLVLALPRGGVPVGSAIAKALSCPLDVIPLMKIPFPWSPEANFGVVAMDGTTVLNMPLINRLELSEAELKMTTSRVLQEAERRDQLYRRREPFPDLENRTVILTDDGLASGYSMFAAVSFAKKRRPLAIIVASPVITDTAYRMLVADKEIGCIIALARDAELLFSLPDYYREFTAVTDDDVVRILAEHQH